VTAPWVVRDANGREVERGGDWGGATAVRVLRPEVCSAGKPHIDANGARDGWRICGAPVERLTTGEPTGRCYRCREAEGARRAERAAGQQIDSQRPTFAARRAG
jgi:hypothetical protein